MDGVSILKKGKKYDGKRHLMAVERAKEKLCKCEISDLITDVFLYGSVARGDYSYESDLDLLIVFSKDVIQIEDYTSRIARLKSSMSFDEVNSVDLDIKVFIGQEWDKSESLFVRLIGKDKVSIWH